MVSDGKVSLEDGSSPLTRGKQEGSARRVWPGRLIPAHAGKTTASKLSSPPATAHPRSRGENTLGLSTMRVRSGSSPLTRGKRDRRLHVVDEIRLIPAHAGKTGPDLARQTATPAHPRSRGENRVPDATVSESDGSSPLTRGKQEGHRLRFRHRRLIPAHAGKTGLGVRWLYFVKAHPRSHGENLFARRTTGATAGSSPLTRGKHAGRHADDPRQRLIPAHAGKTCSQDERQGQRPAHPRSRGENMQAAMQTTRDNGSSPLTRGKPSRGDQTRDVRRLIPAHAGKTRLT